AEAVEVTYDAEQTSFAALARYFFEIHDPTVDRTGKGGQYRSAIFYQDREQHDTALMFIQQLQKLGYEVATKLEPASPFWEAEERHQKYCDKHGRKPQPKQVKRFESPAV
ncbi:MAG TPA: peptide-methionine (S)-S-oxide reductase, partial [Phaeodactylibacter sp.]|nr:peptide-methionine (S)-S-oxide reductase [Phaeodactylibacter sp.]